MRGERDYLDTFGKTSAEQAQERLLKDAETSKKKNQGELILEAVSALIMEVKALRGEVRDLDRKLSKRR